MSRYLIVNADDLGHPAGTVEATADLFEAGVVTSASTMVNQPHWPRAAALLRDHPNWAAGVHLVMNDGQPVLPPRQVPTLVDHDGRFRDGMALLRRYPLLSRAHLKAEWRAQIERFVDGAGRAPSHLDLHCHYPYVFPTWFRLSLELAEEYGGIAIRTPFDDALEQKAAELSASYGGFPPWFIIWQGRRYRRMVERRGLPRADYWESSFSQDGRRTAEVLLEILDRLPEGVTEVLCHPGTEGWRLEDTQALLDPRVRQRIKELGIHMTDYQAVAQRRRR